MDGGVDGGVDGSIRAPGAPSLEVEDGVSMNQRIYPDT